MSRYVPTSNKRLAPMGQKLKKQQGRPVGPVEVVQDHHEGLTLSRIFQEGSDRVEQAKAGRLRLQVLGRFQVR